MLPKLDILVPFNSLITSSMDFIPPFEIVHCTPTEAEVIINLLIAERGEKHEAPDEIENIVKRLCSAAKVPMCQVKLREIMQIPASGIPKMEMPSMGQGESPSKALITEPNKMGKSSSSGSDSALRVKYALLEPIIDQLSGVDFNWAWVYHQKLLEGQYISRDITV